jgi:hypothetical protein
MRGLQARGKETLRVAHRSALQSSYLLDCMPRNSTGPAREKKLAAMGTFASSGLAIVSCMVQ